MEPIPPCVQDPEEEDSWETVYRPEPCEVVAGYHDSLHIHYSAQVSLHGEAMYSYIRLYLRIYTYLAGGRLQVRQLGGQLAAARASRAGRPRHHRTRAGRRAAGCVSLYLVSIYISTVCV